MYTKRLLVLLAGSMLFFNSHAQVKETTAEVDIHSLNLYNAAQWKELMAYGREKLSAGIDFPLLRMRTGYAAFMLGNYGQSLAQYKKVLDADPTNSIALYYVYLDNLYLTNTTAARYYARKLMPETKAAEKIHSFRFSGVDGEFGYKMPQNNMRGNATYGRIGFGLQLGYRLELQQSGAVFNQQLNEPLLLRVINNRNINNNQKEYYAKLTFGLSGRTALLGGYHYIYTPFNNLVYNNHLVFGGIKYSSPFVQVKAMAAFGNMTDTSYSQFDLTVSTYPLGNTRLYTISRMAYGDAFTFSQVLGYRIAKPLWLEANITLGHYNNLLENDALYVFNDIDRKQFKAGGSLYLSFAKKGLFSVNYTFDQKLQYGGLNKSFYQNSLNTAISWKF
jgi:hypothetical protein